MDRLYDEASRRREPGYRDHERVAVLPVDVYATASELVVRASVPAAAPEDVDLTLEGDTLPIKGQIPAPLDNVDYHIQERSYGVFGRTLTLNPPVQAEQAKATFQNGELTLVIHKAEEVRPRLIKVKAH